MPDATDEEKDVYRASRIVDQQIHEAPPANAGY
jgi:hypothetical protein